MINKLLKTPDSKMAVDYKKLMHRFNNSYGAINYKKYSFGAQINQSQKQYRVEAGLGNQPVSQPTNQPVNQPVNQRELPRIPTPTLLAYMTQKYTAAPVEVKFFNTLTPEQMFEKYGKAAQESAQELAQRAGVTNQVLNWIGVLPQEQLKRLDEIYALAQSMHHTGIPAEKLGIIGIGGSRHTIENLLSLNGMFDKAVFLSAVTPEDIDSFVKKLGDKNTAAVMVASKSGTTLEPSAGFEYVRKALGDDFKNYVCITDKDEAKSKLRRLANEKGYKCGVIHDDCGGRFGAFDDHALAALAYCGMPKENMKKMLEASLKAQQKFLNPDIKNNPALKRAAFNVQCVLSGKTNQHDYYFGDRFEGTALWNTQMKKESHKSLYKVSADLSGPAFLHNSTESDLDKGNVSSFYTFNAVKNNGSEPYKAYNALLNGSLKAYSAQHPLSLVELKDFSPESIAEFVELKHFETMYTGMMLRALKMSDNGKTPDKPEVLPEVLQPNVNIYKKEVNAILKH